MAITEQRMTLAEFLELPEQKPALEYPDGVVTQKVSSQFDHGLTQVEFARSVNNPTIPKRLAIAVSELRVTLAGASPLRSRSARERTFGLRMLYWRRLPAVAYGSILRA